MCVCVLCVDVGSVSCNKEKINLKNVGIVLASKSVSGPGKGHGREIQKK